MDVAFRAFVIIKNKTVLSSKDINELRKFLAIKTYVIEANNNPIIDFDCYEMAIAFYDDKLYIGTEDGIIERTEEDTKLIEDELKLDFKFDYITLPHDMPLPIWAVRYLYNNSTDDDFKNNLINNSELNIFN
jgi:hypothetical protein